MLAALFPKKTPSLMTQYTTSVTEILDRLVLLITEIVTIGPWYNDNKQYKQKES
jgi:hypothetical protein